MGFREVEVTELLFLVLMVGSASAIWLIMWAQSKLFQMDSELQLITIARDWVPVRLDAFAMRTGVHAAFANWYLSRKARQLNALREVDEFGDIVFLFREAKRQFFQEHLSKSSH